MQFLLIALCLWLAGCGSQSYVRTLEKYGHLHISPATSTGHDYVVQVRSKADAMFDTENVDERRRMAVLAIEAQCPGAHVVGEHVIEQGGGSRSYFLQVKCLR